MSTKPIEYSLYDRIIEIFPFVVSKKLKELDEQEQLKIDREFKFFSKGYPNLLLKVFWEGKEEETYQITISEDSPSKRYDPFVLLYFSVDTKTVSISDFKASQEDVKGKEAKSKFLWTWLKTIKSRNYNISEALKNNDSR